MTLNRHFMSGRDSAFGVPMCPPAQIRKDLRNVFTRCAAELRLLARPTTREFPLKKLRSNLAHALQCDVIFQPVLKTSSYRGKAKNISPNPVWDSAPCGAFYKAKRLCSLLQPLVTHGFRANIEHELERLAINIWRMPKRHFDGLLRRIRSKIVLASKSPEAVQGFVTLSTNPILSKDRVFWFTRDQRKGSKNPGVDSGLLSQKLGLVRWAKRKLRRELSSP